MEAKQRWGDDLIASVDQKSVDGSQVLYLPPITGENVLMLP